MSRAPLADDLTPANAAALDAADSLAGLREQFYLPKRPDGTPCLYLCGNSLGLQPRSAAQYIEDELDAWRRYGVEGHFEGKRPWMPYHENLTRGLCHVLGARPIEVAAMNTLTVNLHLLMVSFFRPQGARNKILVEKHSFPSDRYAVVSQLKYHGLDPDECLIEMAPREGEHCLRSEDIEDLLQREGKRIALMMLGGVQYYTGQLFDIPRLTRAARDQGCVVGWDLAHAAGNVPLALHDDGVDFATWCSYKYLNSGPGAVSGCFVHERHANRDDLPRFAGWWGHDQATRFKMGPDFKPMPGAEGWQLSNPPILSLAPVIASLALFEEATLPALRAKSVALTGLLEARLRRNPHVEQLTPGDPAQRGCQLSLKIRDTAKTGGRALFDALTERGVICDWREPAVIRIAPVPSYNQFADVIEFTDVLAELTGT